MTWIATRTILYFILEFDRCSSQTLAQTLKFEDKSLS